MKNQSSKINTNYKSTTANPQRIEFKNRKISNLIIISALLIFIIGTSFGQVLDSKKGKIDNKGRIVIKGQAVFNQDTLGGRVDFVSFQPGVTQYVQSIVYNYLVFNGTSQKVLSDSGKNLVTLTHFHTSAAPIKMDANSLIESKGVTEHLGQINTDFTWGKVKLDGNQLQDIYGNGLFKILELDNDSGAAVTKSGGFKIGNKLELTRGKFYNSNDSNFIIGNGATISRTANGSVAAIPVFEGNANIQYIGTGTENIATGPEISDDSTVIQDLLVENSGGITLSKSFTVNNNIYVGSTIYTEPDSLNKHTLSYRGTNNPIFANNDAEIIGGFRRTYLPVGEQIIFNNPYTYALFVDAASRNGTKSLTFRIKPRSAPPYINGEEKVKRQINLMATDENGNLIQSGVYITLGYGWRHIPANPTKDETNNLPVPSLILQRYLDESWLDFTNSAPPIVDNQIGWAYSSTEEVTPYGDFAIGMPGSIRMKIAAHVFLEGPYQNGSMAAELLSRNLLPLTPADVYPYNLDPKRTSYQVISIPDSVVDWIVLEFRTQITGGTSSFKTAFLKQDGRIVDLDGVSPVQLTGRNLNAGDYYVAVRHRNHLSVLTNKPINIYPSTEPTQINFSNPDELLGGTNSLKLIDLLPGNTLLFGMIAGDTNGDGVINDEDFLNIWDSMDSEGYLTTDMNLNGLVTTKDYNISWNNRGRTSQLP